MRNDGHFRFGKNPIKLKLNFAHKRIFDLKVKTTTIMHHPVLITISSQILHNTHNNNNGTITNFDTLKKFVARNPIYVTTISSKHCKTD